MFNVGSQELLIIFILVFLLFGPRHIPDVAQALGRGIGELKRTLSGVEEGIRRTTTEVTDSAKPSREYPSVPRSEIDTTGAFKPQVPDEDPGPTEVPSPESEAPGSTSHSGQASSSGERGKRGEPPGGTATTENGKR